MVSPLDSGTPVGNGNLHRRTLLRNAVGVTPLRRRSIIQSPVIPLLEKSNDEHERSNRRSFVDIQRRLSSIPQANSPLSDFSRFEEKDMKDHIQICTKLFTENKITVKNAWKLHIIDLLKHLSQKPNADILQVASTSLDISAKVYGIRVDDIHADGLKLASNMARIGGNKESSRNRDDNEGSDVDDERENSIVKRKKKAKRLLAGKKPTICKDPKQLRAPLPKLESAFFSTRINAEASAIDNLFTNTLKMDHSGYKFMLLSGEKAWPHETDPLVKDVNDPNCKKYPCLITAVPNIKLCAPFSNFEVDEWNLDEEEKQLAAERSRQEEVVFDNNGIPIHELDGSLCDIFADNPHDDEEMADADDIQSIHEEIVPQLRGDVAKVVDFRPGLSEGMQISEYGYNTIINTRTGKVIDQIWAGPSHWKVKYVRRSSSRFSGQVSTEVRQTKHGRRKAQPQMIDFFGDYEEFDLTKKLKIKKKPPTVDSHKITLPIPDISCTRLMDHLTELITKPGVCPVRKKLNNDNNQIDYEVSTYKYDNPNDSQYCSQQNGADSDGDNAPFDDNGDRETEDIVAQQGFTGDNLVEAPEAIPHSYIPYALQAKKMDMKKLKAAVWHILTQATDDNVDHARDKVVTTTFSKVFSELPEQLPEKMRKELSCSLAFVALLHLCNEQNLALKQHLGYKNFDIQGPPQK